MQSRALSKDILILLPVLLVGGTEIQTMSLVRALRSGGYNVSVCCYYEHDDSVISQIERSGTNVILLNLHRSAGISSLFLHLKRLIEDLEPHIVHVQYIAPGLIPIIAAKMAGVRKIFATVHQPGRPYGWRPKFLIQVSAQLCDVFFCNSRSVEESWFQTSQIFDPNNIDKRRKHFTIYNGVDVDNIGKTVEEADSESLKESLEIRGKKVVGTVGRLRREKGQATLLESMKTVIQELPDAVLIVVGNGPDRPYLEEMAKKLGIDSYVKWLGQKDHDEVIRLYSIMDVVVVPSLFEGFGLTAAEAMAAGRAVVASKVDGLTEVIRDGVNGLLFPVGDSKAVGSAILELLSNSEKAASMGARGRQLVVNEFSLERFRSAILAAYARHGGAQIRCDLL
jgi:glycosyltransferase involved in cell wall biosynthesis